jgi:hypothetical protein
MKHNDTKPDVITSQVGMDVCAGCGCADDNDGTVVVSKWLHKPDVERDGDECVQQNDVGEEAQHTNVVGVGLACVWREDRKVLHNNNTRTITNTCDCQDEE